MKKPNSIETGALASNGQVLQLTENLDSPRLFDLVLGSGSLYPVFAPITVVHPAMGADIITVAFVVVVIGGLGSFWGVVLAALLVGVVRGVTIHFVPAAGEASMYVLMFLVLLLRPRGLLGERIEKFE